MIWKLEWDHAARHGLLSLPMRTAERLDAALLRFADTGRGPVVRQATHDPRRLILSVSGAVAYLYADEQAGILFVGRVYART